MKERHGGWVERGKEMGWGEVKSGESRERKWEEGRQRDEVGREKVEGGVRQRVSFEFYRQSSFDTYAVSPSVFSIPLSFPPSVLFLHLSLSLLIFLFLSTYVSLPLHILLSLRFSLVPRPRERDSTWARLHSSVTHITNNCYILKFTWLLGSTHTS